MHLTVSCILVADQAVGANLTYTSKPSLCLSALVLSAESKALAISFSLSPAQLALCLSWTPLLRISLGSKRSGAYNYTFSIAGNE